MVFSRLFKKNKEVDSLDRVLKITEGLKRNLEAFKWKVYEQQNQPQVTQDIKDEYDFIVNTWSNIFELEILKIYKDRYPENKIIQILNPHKSLLSKLKKNNKNYQDLLHNLNLIGSSLDIIINKLHEEKAK